MATSRNFRNDIRIGKNSLPTKEWNAAFEALHTKILENLLTQQESWSDPSIYTGRCGVALLWLHFSECLSRKGLADGEKSRQGLEASLRITSSAENKFSTNRHTFLTGSAGSIAIKVLACHYTDDKVQAVESMKKLLSLSNTMLNLPFEECELLRGRCGFLYALLFIKDVWLESELEHDFLKLIYTLMDQIIHAGLVTKNSRPKLCKSWPLYYQWHDKCYLGGAHGVAGIFLILLYAGEILQQAHSNLSAKIDETRYKSLICETCSLILRSFRFPSGNIASSVESHSDTLVHWCHGAPGWIPVLIKLSKLCNKEPTIFSDREFYESCLMSMGEVVWERGLLKKGVGLCHGISGNAFSLLSIHRYTGNPTWLRRAQEFARFGMNHFEELVLIPDSPYSLFEGMAGFALLLQSLLYDNNSFFTGYELLGV